MSDYGWHRLMWTVITLSFSENTADWFYNQYNYYCHVSTPIYYPRLTLTTVSQYSITVGRSAWCRVEQWAGTPRVLHSLSVLNGGILCVKRRHLVWQSTNLCWCKQGDPWCRGVATPSPITDWLTDWLTESIHCLVSSSNTCLISSMMYLFTLNPLI